MKNEALTKGNHDRLLRRLKAGTAGVTDQQLAASSLQSTEAEVERRDKRTEELEDEAERQRLARANAEVAYENEHRWVESAKAEVERLRKVLADTDAEMAIGRSRNRWLEDEVRRLSMLVQNLGVQRDELEEGLRRIESMADAEVPDDCGPDTGHWLDEIGTVAQDALAQTKREDR